MRKLASLSLIVFIASIDLFAQNITLTFKGEEKASETPMTVEQVHVFNLSNTTDTLIDGNTLYLGSAGIDDYNIALDLQLRSYPNPFSSETNLVVNSPNNNYVIIKTYTIDGKELASFSGQVYRGANTYRFTSNKEGLIFLTVNTGTEISAIKLLCTQSKGESEIAYTGQQWNLPGLEKRAPLYKATGQNDFDFSPGDLLEFVGYSGSSIAISLYDTPDENEEYTFQFTERYINLISNNAFKDYPCNLNILFSVENEASFGIDYFSIDNFLVTENDSVITVEDNFLHLRKITYMPYSLKTVLLLDNSGDSDENKTKIKAAALDFIQSKKIQQEVAILSFSDSAFLLQDFTGDKTILENAINAISENFGNRNLYGSVIEAAQQWKNIYTKELIQQGQLIVITGGSDNVSSSSLQETIDSLNGKKCYILGIGSEIDSESLDSIASPGRLYFEYDYDGLDEIVNKIQYDIHRQSNSLYQINYMSDERGGRDNYKVQFKENLNTNESGSIEGKFVTSSFVTAELGVYINVMDYLRYGPGVVSINKNNDLTELWATTYGFSKWPDYSWTESGGNSLSINPDPIDPSSTWINSNDPEMYWTEVTVIDHPNNYSNQIIVTNTHTTVSSDSVEICFETCGEGEPTILFIHGWGMHRSYWDEQVSHFFNKYKVVSVDLAGRGESGNNRVDWTMSSFGQDVAAVIEELDLSRVILVGHSMGAPSAIEAALKTPERCIGIVICDIMYGLSFNYTQEWIDNEVSSTMEQVQSMNLEVYRAYFTKNRVMLASRLYDMWDGIPLVGWAESGENFYHWLNDNCIDAIERLQIPVLAIKAGSSEGDVTTWREYIPSYNVRVINGVGHQLNWENPGLFNQYLEESIQEFLGN